jgi:RND family efflux transporter MFP subunit
MLFVKLYGLFRQMTIYGAAAMTFGLPKAVFFSLLLFLGMIGAAGPASSQPGSAGGPPPSPVVVEPVTEETVDSTVELVGSARAWKNSRVAAEVSGKVTELKVDQGDRVEKGAILCRLDADELKHEIREAEAAVKEAQARLERADKEYKRLAALIDKQSVSERARDEAFYDYLAGVQEVERSRAALGLLKERLRNKTVEAPFSGVVVERFTQVGEWLSPGSVVVELFLTDPVKVVVPVPEKVVHLLSVGDSVPLTFDALDKESYRGKIHAVIPKGNEATRTFPVHIRLENPESRVRPGMLARAHFSLGDPKKVLLVPKDAIVLSGAIRSVVKVVDGKAVPVTVRMGLEHRGKVEVEGDLKPGDAVVVMGNERLFPGQPVQVSEES